MNFNSIEYILIYLPVVVIIYHILRVYKGGKYTNLMLLGASYLFYGLGGLIYLPPLIASSLIDYFGGKRIDSSDRQKYRKILLISCMTFDLCLLFFFKYAKWLTNGLNGTLGYMGLSFNIPVVDVPLPPGISFYTFQTMCYTIDVYNKKISACQNIVDYMTYVTFWPQLVAGPIERAKSLLLQLQKVRKAISADSAVNAISIIAWGLFKKVVLADNFGQIVESIDEVFKSGVGWNKTGLGLLYGYAFAGQIYCDFSAYTDIARGSARLIGVELMRNFKTPYFSVSPSDFWQRWHISLSSWLRDYVYIPMGGNRVSRTREFMNLLIVMGLIGLWHGAGGLFIAWGIYHGLLLILYRIIPIDNHLINSFRWSGGKISQMTRIPFSLESWGCKLGSIIAIVIMFHFACFGWILFRADMQTIKPIIQSIMDIPVTQIAPLFTVYLTGLVSLGTIVFITDILGYKVKDEFIDRITTMPLLAKTVLLVAVYFGIILLGKREGVQFIYFQF